MNLNLDPSKMDSSQLHQHFQRQMYQMKSPDYDFCLNLLNKMFQRTEENQFQSLQDIYHLKLISGTYQDTVAERKLVRLQKKLPHKFPEDSSPVTNQMLEIFYEAWPEIWEIYKIPLPRTSLTIQKALRMIGKIMNKFGYHLTLTEKMQPFTTKTGETFQRLETLVSVFRR